MDTMNIEEIHKKLQTDWADWTDDDEDQCLSIRKKELISALEAINAYLVSFDLKTRIEKDPTQKVCEFCQKTYKGAEPVCDKCLLDMKLKLRRFSFFLSEKNMRKVYSEILDR
ncbi:MAG: hypothetical protein ACXVH4_04630 [Halobacteriota archaeon]